MKLLIVDDDYQIREGMRYGIKWNELGITEVETCANGLEAMHVVVNKMPDIIVADIQMPGMNGLEMIAKIREKDTRTKVIFISAYSEFEYCRKALVLGANDYVLKPIQMDEFLDVIKKNVTELNEEKERNIRFRKAVVGQMARDIYIAPADINTEEFATELRKEYPILKSDYFITILFHLDKNRITDEEKKEVIESLKDYMEEKIVLLIESESLCWGISEGNNSALVTFYLQNRIKQRLGKWNEIYEGKYGSISAGISQSHIGKDIKIGLIQAQYAIKKLFYQEKGMAMLYISDEATENKESENALKEIRHENHLEYKKEYLENYLNRAKENFIDKNQFKKYLLEFYRKYSKGYTWELEITHLESKLNHLDYARDCIELIDAALENKMDYLKEMGEKKYSHTVMLAEEYIRKHFCEPITAVDVAMTVEKSPNYFSSTFKKETGKSFTRYLNDLRLERAKWLLLHTNQQVSEICGQVGYTDYIYFSQLFKQRYGCSASKLRNNEAKNTGKE